MESVIFCGKFHFSHPHDGHKGAASVCAEKFGLFLKMTDAIGSSCANKLLVLFGGFGQPQITRKNAILKRTLDTLERFREQSCRNPGNVWEYECWIPKYDNSSLCDDAKSNPRVRVLCENEPGYIAHFIIKYANPELVKKSGFSHVICTLDDSEWINLDIEELLVYYNLFQLDIAQPALSNDSIPTHAKMNGDYGIKALWNRPKTKYIGRVVQSMEWFTYFFDVRRYSLWWEALDLENPCCWHIDNCLHAEFGMRLGIIETMQIKHHLSMGPYLGENDPREVAARRYKEKRKYKHYDMTNFAETTGLLILKEIYQATAHGENVPSDNVQNKVISADLSWDSNFSKRVATSKNSETSIGVSTATDDKVAANTSVVDVVFLDNEIDLLIARLCIMGHLVSNFVIVESPINFNQETKPLHFKNVLQQDTTFDKTRFCRIAHLLHKVVHIIAPTPVSLHKDWRREFRTTFYNSAVSGLMQIPLLKASDVVCLSHASEVPNTSTLRSFLVDNHETIASSNFTIKVLDQEVQCYNWNFSRDDHWSGTVVCAAHLVFTLTPSDLFTKRASLEKIADGGWRLEYFGKVDYIRDCIKNSDEDIARTNQIDTNQLIQYATTGIDPFGRCQYKKSQQSRSHIPFLLQGLGF